MAQIFPSLHTGQRSKILSVEWHHLFPVEKGYWEDLYARYRAAFDKEQPDYEFTRSPNGQGKNSKGKGRAPTGPKANPKAHASRPRANSRHSKLRRKLPPRYRKARARPRPLLVPVCSSRSFAPHSARLVPERVKDHVKVPSSLPDSIYIPTSLTPSIPVPPPSIQTVTNPLSTDLRRLVNAGHSQ